MLVYILLSSHACPKRTPITSGSHQTAAPSCPCPSGGAFPDRRAVPDAFCACIRCAFVLTCAFHCRSSTMKGFRGSLVHVSQARLDFACALHDEDESGCLDSGRA